MIHETIVKDGVSTMEMRDKLILAAGEEVDFKQGGLHLMLMYKTKVFKQGDLVHLKFTTSKGIISITAPVKNPVLVGQ
jgi:copper(I)-binding protein